MAGQLKVETSAFVPCVRDWCCAGILGMPNGAFLYADQLLSVLTAKSEQGGFKDLVIYVVGCMCSYKSLILYFYVTWLFAFRKVILSA